MFLSFLPDLCLINFFLIRNFEPRLILNNGACPVLSVVTIVFLFCIVLRDEMFSLLCLRLKQLLAWLHSQSSNQQNAWVNWSYVVGRCSNLLADWALDWYIEFKWGILNSSASSLLLPLEQWRMSFAEPCMFLTAFSELSLEIR